MNPTPFYKKEAVTPRKPDMPYLNRCLEEGRIVLTYSGILDQDFKTADDAITITREHAGRFYGGGIHQFSWFSVCKHGKEVFRSAFAEYPYLYVERYLKRVVS